MNEYNFHVAAMLLLYVLPKYIFTKNVHIIYKSVNIHIFGTLVVLVTSPALRVCLSVMLLLLLNEEIKIDGVGVSSSVIILVPHILMIGQMFEG